MNIPGVRRSTVCAHNSAAHLTVPNTSTAAPAREGAYYGIVTTNVNGNPYKGKFTGNPGPEVDGAWQRLLRGKKYSLMYQSDEFNVCSMRYGAKGIQE